MRSRGKEERTLLAENPDSIIARIIYAGKKGVLFDASYSENYRKTMFQLFKKHSTVTTDTAAVKFHVNKKLISLLDDPRVEKANKLVEAKHRHVLIQYNKKFIIKLYRKIDRGTDRDVEICNYLCNQKNFNLI